MKWVKEDPVLASVEKYATHSSIKNIKSKMNVVNSNFFFIFVDHDQGFNEIKRFNGHKTSQKMISQSKECRKISISSLMLFIINSITPCLFLSNLKEADITPAYKK